jgi:putative SOS response-associated peptidase YedK
MCNHYRNPNEWRELPRDLQHKIILPARNTSDVWPGRFGPVVIERGGELVAEVMRWGFPTYRPGKRDPAKLVTTYWTNARNLSASLWREWIGQAGYRCLVLATAFAEPDPARGKRGEAWFGMADREAPGFAFAGLWRPTSEGPHYAFLTCLPNQLVGAIHPKAMPVILAPGDYRHWIAGEPAEQFQRPFDAALMAEFE